MFKQMCWLPLTDTSDEKILHLRTAANQPWQPYTGMPQYAVPDYREPGGSKGWATYQHLLKQGWKLVPTATEQQFHLARQLKSA
jgi:hypothetical protein